MIDLNKIIVVIIICLVTPLHWTFSQIINKEFEAKKYYDNNSFHHAPVFELLNYDEKPRFGSSADTITHAPDIELFKESKWEFDTLQVEEIEQDDNIPKQEKKRQRRKKKTDDRTLEKMFEEIWDKSIYDNPTEEEIREAKKYTNRLAKLNLFHNSCCQRFLC